MSENILELGETKVGQVIVTRFAGGVKRGLCYQLNGPIETGDNGYVQYTETEAVQVARAILRDAVPDEALEKITDKKDVEILRRVYKEVRYAWRKGTQLPMYLAAEGDDPEAVEARALWDQFVELAKRLKIACSVKDCFGDAEKVGAKCWYCQQKETV